MRAFQTLHQHDTYLFPFSEFPLNRTKTACPKFQFYSTGHAVDEYHRILVLRFSFSVRTILSDTEQRQAPIDHVKRTETETIKSGQATFHCDGRIFKHLPGVYTVYLSSGHSIQQHSATIQKRITPYMRSTFDGIPIHEIVYRASGIDEKLLSAIRSDPIVYLVECGHNQEPAQDAAAKYQATFLCRSVEDRIPHS